TAPSPHRTRFERSQAPAGSVLSALIWEGASSPEVVDLPLASTAADATAVEASAAAPTTAAADPDGGSVGSSTSGASRSTLDGFGAASCGANRSIFSFETGRSTPSFETGRSTPAFDTGRSTRSGDEPTVRFAAGRSVTSDTLGAAPVFGASKSA